MLFSDCVHDPVNGLDKNQIHQHHDVLDIVLPVSCADMLVVSCKCQYCFPYIVPSYKGKRTFAMTLVTKNG